MGRHGTAPYVMCWVHGDCRSLPSLFVAITLFSGLHTYGRLLLDLTNSKRSLCLKLLLAKCLPKELPRSSMTCICVHRGRLHLT